MAEDTNREAKLRELDRVAGQKLAESGNCAQTVFAVLKDEFDLAGQDILRALTPFPGLALRGETCGAVTGGLMAIGLVFGRDRLDDWQGYVASLPPARRFCRGFTEENGTTACADILKNKLGCSYDLANPVEASKYAAAGGAEKCGEVVALAVRLAAEIIIDNTPDR